jgi:hypothetical protein
MSKLLAKLRLECLDVRALPSTVLATETDVWPGPNNSTATITATVTQEDDSTFKWNYHLRNDSFVYGADDFWGIGYLVIPVWDSSVVTNVGSSIGADWFKDGVFSDPSVDWLFASEGTPGLKPGQEGDFWFSTPAQRIAVGGGAAWSYDVGDELTGATLNPAQPPTITLTIGNNKFIPLNANDTYGAPLTDGVPMRAAVGGGTAPVFDFQVNPMRQWIQVGPEALKADPDLVQASFAVANPVQGGTVSLSVTVNNAAPNHGQIRLWKERTKENDFVAQNPHAVTDNTFYIEGIEPSTALNDITITATYNFGPGAQSVKDSQKVTVTPMINNYSITPRAAPNVTWTNTTNGLQGLTTNGGMISGASFSATLTRTGVAGNSAYIHNMTALDNGVNGAAAGWVFTNALGPPRPSLNTVLTGGDTLPILDMFGADRPAPPDYRSTFTMNTADTQQITAEDNPSTGWPDASSELKDIDVRYKFTMYLVWRFADNTVYTLARDNWQVTFRADTWALGQGVTRILPVSGITVDANYTVTHVVVPVRNGRTFNQSNAFA